MSKSVLLQDRINAKGKECYESTLKAKYEERDKHECYKRYSDEEFENHAKGVATHTTIMDALERRDYKFDDYNVNELNAYDVIIPQTIVGNLRHPYLVTGVYYNEERKGIEISVAWYDEIKNKLVTDNSWTPIIKAIENGTAFSGNTIVNYEFAKAINDCVYEYGLKGKSASVGNGKDIRFRQAENFYYIGNTITGNMHTVGYNNNARTYVKGSLISAEELKLNLYSLDYYVIAAPTYIDVYNWFTTCVHNNILFFLIKNEYNKWKPIFEHSEIISKEIINSTYNSYEEAIIGTFMKLYEFGYIHPYYLYDNYEYSEKTMQKILNSNYLSDEEYNYYIKSEDNNDETFDDNSTLEIKKECKIKTGKTPYSSRIIYDIYQKSLNN